MSTTPPPTVIDDSRPLSFIKRLAALAWPKYSRLIDMINRNPDMVEWIRANQHIPSFASRHDYFDHLQRVVLHGRQIDFLEFGVFKGASLKWWAEANANPASRFWGFDSFEGLPETMDWMVGGTPVGHLSVNGLVPDVGDARVEMVKGMFQDTLDPFLDRYTPRGTLVVHLDADIYSSTLFALTKLDRHIARGAIVLFDEFPSALQEYRAFVDYVSSHGRAYRALATSVYRYAFAMGANEQVIESLLRPPRV
jgi:O-methyltransferase